MLQVERYRQIHPEMQMWAHFMQRDAGLGNITCRKMQT